MRVVSHPVRLLRRVLASRLALGAFAPRPALRYRLPAAVLAVSIAFLATGALSYAGDPASPGETDGGAEDGPVTSAEGDPRIVDGGIAVNAGGQFLFWDFSGGTTASFWFGSLTIAWLFDAEAPLPVWVSYVPALGQTILRCTKGPVLWLVAPRELKLRPGGCPSPVLLCPPG